MNHKKVIKTTVFPASREAIWEKLQYLQTLQYIAYPYATFKPIDKKSVFVWKQGERFMFHFKLFGIVPFGVHEINVEQFDKETYAIYTNEANTYVQVWNHRIYLEYVDDNQTKYTDEVEIYAGWKTAVIYLWAKSFYAHRQKKWLKLLRYKLTDGERSYCED